MFKTMIVYKITDLKGWTKEKDFIGLQPVKYKAGYFLPPGLEGLWPELNWNELQKIEITENDLIKEEP